MDYKNIKLSPSLSSPKFGFFVHLLIICNAMLFFVITMLINGMDWVINIILYLPNSHTIQCWNTRCDFNPHNTM
jgi:hypothetical protein